MFMQATRHAVLRSCLAVLTLCVMLLAGHSTASGAQPLPSDDAFQLSVQRESGQGLRFEWRIAPGYYLYQDKFALTQGSADLSPGTLQGQAETHDDPTFGKTVIFHNSVATSIPGPGQNSEPIVVHYQGCQADGICYPPVVRYVDASTLKISAPPENPSPSLANAWVDRDAAPTQSGITIAEGDDSMVGALLEDGGVPLVLGSFLLFGILLAFTPCVFPMYPILAGAIARQGERASPLRGFSLSVSYVVAMATAFGLLGIVAAWSGQNLQMALQSPLAIGAVSALFIILALSMFGLFELQLPSAWVNALGGMGQGRRGSLASAGLLGFTSALIVGPCVTAPLAGALIYIAQTGDVALGAASLFALGLGKGIPLIAFGTLGPTALPKAGPWMARVRQAFGFVFIATAILMVSRLLPASASLALWSALALGIAVWLGAFDTLEVEASGARRTAKTAGLVAALWAIVLGLGAASGAQDPLRPLAQLAVRGQTNAPQNAKLMFSTVGDARELQTRIASSDGRPSLVYVTADWCVTCAAIEKDVLTDPAAISGLAGFNLIKLDVTDNASAQRDVMKNLRVAGPPTMIFVNEQGQEAGGTRLVGDVTTPLLQAAADKVLNTR